jgi:multidrug transporter EmrE-like cation transporter
MARNGLGWIDHIYILGTLFFTVGGQLLLKWQMAKVGSLPPELAAKCRIILWQLANPWIVAAFASAFLASVCWMITMTRFELTYAYPFMGLAFVLVLAFAVAFLGEPLTVSKVVGTLIVSAGIAILTR